MKYKNMVGILLFVVTIINLGFGSVNIVKADKTSSIEVNRHTRYINHANIDVEKLDLDSLVNLYEVPKELFTQEEQAIIQNRIENLSFEEMEQIIDKKAQKDIEFSRKLSHERKYEKAFIEANVELYKETVKNIPHNTKFKDLSGEDFLDAMRNTLEQDHNRDLKNLISFTGQKLGENTILRSFDQQTIGSKFLRINRTYAGIGWCDYDTRWPNFARAEWKWGSYHTATGVDRVKNSRNEYPCDYRVHFNARKWVTVDGYDSWDYRMVSDHGGVGYSTSGDRVIVGYGSSLKAGNFTIDSVRHGIIMRTW